MNIFPDLICLNALYLPAQLMVGLFIACDILLLFDWGALLNLGNLPAKPIVVVVEVFTGSLSIVAIINFFGLVCRQTKAISSQRAA